jgi:hypothetical protein
MRCSFQLEEKMFRNAPQFKLNEFFFIGLGLETWWSEGNYECSILIFILMEEVSTNIQKKMKFKWV